MDAPIKKVRATFRKYERISKAKEIKTVLETGEKLFIEGVIFYAISRFDEFKFSRLCILVSSKIEKLSVRRNKFKRRIREIFRLNKHKILKPIDLVVIATKCSVRYPYKKLEEIFIEALKNFGVI
ncbi:MAG: ribonuclease P protein component [Endomicrobia bacterium]|nr:ribonuclease P protein component [Endomicrobiia bacterium]